MGTSRAKLNKELSSLTPDTLVDLYEIDFSNLQVDFEMLEDLYGANIGAEPVYRFCPMINGTNPIIWQGKSYQPLPVRMDEFDQKADGTLPRPKMVIANPDGLFSKIVHSNKDFSNCKVTRKRTYAKFLDEDNFQNRNLNDSGSNPFGTSDSGSHLADDVFFINKKSLEGKSFIEFELVSSLELENSPVPARVVLSSSCGWTYRCSIGCRYTGLPIETSSSEDLTDTIDPLAYPDKTSDIPEWSRYGKSGEKLDRKLYNSGDLVKIIAKSSSDPYRKVPQVFVCVRSHADASNHHPFFDKEHWLRDECPKTLSSCRKRFSGNKLTHLHPFNGAQNSPGLPFGGFPGTERYPVE